MSQDSAMMSAPVDLDNPGFDSLLSALKAVHTGEMGMDVLRRYHAALTSQIEASRRAILDLPIPEGLESLDSEQRNMALSGLAVVNALLDQLAAYITQPSQENVAACVQLLLQSQRLMEDLRAWLDAFAASHAQTTPPEAGS